MYNIKMVLVYYFLCCIYLWCVFCYLNYLVLLDLVDLGWCCLNCMLFVIGCV